MPFTLHYHRVPACAGAGHDPSCAPLGDEDACVELQNELKGWCVCTHYEAEDLAIAVTRLGETLPVTVPLPWDAAGTATRRVSFAATRVQYPGGAVRVDFDNILLPSVTVQVGPAVKQAEEQEPRTMITGIAPNDLRGVIDSLPERPVGDGRCQLVKRRDTPGGGNSVGCAGDCDSGRCPRNPQMWLDAAGNVGLRCACG